MTELEKETMKSVYMAAYMDGLTACNTVGADLASKDANFHYGIWLKTYTIKLKNNK